MNELVLGVLNCERWMD